MTEALITYKNNLLLEVDTASNFLLFRMKYFIDGGCLSDDWYV